MFSVQFVKEFHSTSNICLPMSFQPDDVGCGEIFRRCSFVGRPQASFVRIDEHFCRSLGDHRFVVKFVWWHLEKDVDVLFCASFYLETTCKPNKHPQQHFWMKNFMIEQKSTSLVTICDVSNKEGERVCRIYWLCSRWKYLTCRYWRRSIEAFSFVEQSLWTGIYLYSSLIYWTLTERY